MAEYIWLGAGGQLRSKTKVLDARPAAPEDAPVLVAQEGCADAGEAVLEVFLKPRKLFRDPFRGGDHVLVLCDTFRPSACGGGQVRGRRDAGAGQDGCCVGAVSQVPTSCVCVPERCLCACPPNAG